MSIQKLKGETNEYESFLQGLTDNKDHYMIDL